MEWISRTEPMASQSTTTAFPTLPLVHRLCRMRGLQSHSAEVTLRPPLAQKAFLHLVSASPALSDPHGKLLLP